MSITSEHLDRLYTAQVVDQDGDTVGKVGQVYLDDQTGAPAWITVQTGFFGSKETFVPLDAADLEGDRIRVPYDKSHIKGAPNFDTDSHLSESEQDELYRYYGLQGSAAGYGQTSYGETDSTGTGYSGTGYAAAGEVDRGADEGRLTLHEERVNVGTERVQTGRVRLRKHLVTEQRTVTVPVQREEFEIVREPVTDGGSADRSDLGSGEIEVAVHEERPVIDKQVVATEQVGVDRRTVTEERAVTTDVSREQVDVVEDDTTGRL